MILGIETSCDDTSCAILNEEGFVLSMCSANQDLVHKPFGGIVPEIASRNHTAVLTPLIQETLKKANLNFQNIKSIAVTNRPGLMGSLLVGVMTAKTLSLAHNIPFIGVHHIEGHILAPFVKDSEYEVSKNFKFPFISLVVSGGHTSLFLVHEFLKYELIGSTIDDAAGEAFDKFAKMLGLGYPGGVQVDRLSQNGDSLKYHFPKAMIHEDHFDFSFSGLKTAAQVQLSKLENPQEHLADLCASYQKAIVDVLVLKLEKAVSKYKVPSISVTGGVSANSGLRKAVQDLANRKNLQVAIPPLKYCTDNAAMIARVGLERFKRNEFSNLDLSVFARSDVPSEI